VLLAASFLLLSSEGYTMFFSCVLCVCYVADKDL